MPDETPHDERGPDSGPEGDPARRPEDERASEPDAASDEADAGFDASSAPGMPAPASPDETAANAAPAAAAADDESAAAPPPGTGEESYPLEVPSDDAPVAPDVPSDRPPCPSCGAARRVPGPVCLRCGWDDAQNRYHLVTETPPDEPASSASASGASVDGAAAAGVTAGAAAGATATTPRTKVEDDELERHERPLVRALPGDPYVPWAVAAACTLVMVIAGLAGAGVLFPDPAVAAGAVDGAGPGAADAAATSGEIGFGARFTWIARTLVVQSMWWAAIAGAGLVFAWFADRRVGDAMGYAGRTLAAVSVARLAALLGVPSVLAAFVVEGVLHLIIATGVCVALLHLRGREAMIIVLGGSVALGGLLVIANVLAWAA